jgi:GT2 family glycosyltransferase
MHKHSLSIVTYNNSVEQLSALYRSISNSTLGLKAVIIDNSSNSDIESITKSYGFTYINPGVNLGFGKAHNIGINYSIQENSKYHIIVNPDITFPEDTIEKLVSVLEQDKSIGILMPRVCYPNGDFQFLCKKLPSPFNLIIRRFIPFKALKDKLNVKYELQELDYSIQQEVPTISGCFLISSTSVLQEMGGFDERFFMYLEDVDLTRRVGMKYKVVYSPEATVYHEYAKDSYKNYKLLKYHISSAIKYFNKWGWIFDKNRITKNRFHETH